MSRDVNPKPKRFEVWYAKSYHPCYAPFLDMEKLLPTVNQLINHYSKIREIDLDGDAHQICEALFRDMNVGTWNQEGHQETIRDLGVHTSMSVGDLIRDRESGKWYKCSSWGFREFEMGVEESHFIDEDPDEDDKPFPCNVCEKTIDERYANPDCNKGCAKLKAYWEEING